MVHIGELWIQNEQEVYLARQWTQKLASLVKLSIGNHARLSSAVSQVAQSLYHYRFCVHVAFDVFEEQGTQFLQITLREAQGFLPSGEQVRTPTLSRKDLLQWLGFTKNIITRFCLEAQEGQPIRVMMAKPLPSWTPYVTEETAQTWREALNGEVPHTLLEEIVQQNQEMVQVLDALREKEKALEQKLAEIQKLENLRDDLVHALVHDLRNPLATIRTSLSGLLYNDTKNLSPYQYAMIEISYSGARKMTQLVNNILDVHKLEREGLPLELKTFSVSKLVQKVINAQASLAQEKNIRLSRHISHRLPPVMGDTHLLERVLQNLTDNALKFTPEGGRVIISAKCLEIEGNPDHEGTVAPRNPYISISVKDTGPGIAPDIETRLFEKFTAGIHEESGSGIGLAFCRMAVQAHGGEIWARNNAGPGATFTFILPIVLPPPTRKASENSSFSDPLSKNA